MDVKGWSIGADSNKCIKRMEMTDIATGSKRYLCMESDLCDCTEDNCSIKFTRPDPAEVERLVDNVIRLRDNGLSYKLSLDYKQLMTYLIGGE